MSSEGTSHFPAPAASSSAFVRRMVGSVALINLFVFGMVAFSLYQSFVEYDERAEMTAQNYSQMLAQDIGREFEKIDITLSSAVDEIDRQLARGRIDGQTLNAYLVRLQERVPEIISLRTTDAQGIVSYGRGVDFKARVNNSDREYFFHQRDNPKAGLVISKPVFARIDKRWVIPVSRAFHLPDGSFAGVVYCNIDLEHLSRMFSAIDVGRRGNVSLRDTEQRIFAYYPVLPNTDKIIGSKLEVPELQALIQSERDAGTFTSIHTVDGVERKFAVRRIGDLQLYAVVGRASDEYLAPWHAQAVKILALEALFFATTLLSSWLIYRGWKRQMDIMDELAREEEKFHTVADFTYDWEYWEGPKGEMLYMSPACERITGYPLAEFLASPELLTRIVLDDDLPLLAEHRHDVEHEDEVAVDFRIVRKDGGIRWIAHACQSVFGRDGQFMGRRISNRDITERQQAEEKLRELNNDFVTLLENTSDFIYFKNHENRFIFCSQTLADVTGHRSWRDMIGKNDLEVFPADTARIYYEEELPIFRDGSPLLNKTDPYYDEQGKQRWVNTNKWPVFGDDKKTVVGIFGISRDITELKEAEDKITELNRELEQRVAQRTAELETALYDLENFNYSASHDLRIPLRAVDGFSSILLEEHSHQLDAEGIRLLKVVRNNTGRMSQLIDDMQAFSHAGRMPMTMTEIDMKALVNEVVEELGPATSGRAISFEIGGLPPVYADRPMMRRVVLDLLANAIKFTRPKANAVIEVGATTGNKETVFFVKDNGVGFDMKFADMLFGVFQRLHGVEEFEGAGIGLAIVKRIMTRLGGRAWAEGKVNEGATVYVALPASARVNGEGA